MTADEFYDGVANHTDEHGQSDMHGWIEERDGETAFCVKHAPTKATYFLPMAAVLEYTWPELERILVGKEPIKALDHMTRVVGYYSKTSNWNRSRLGELLDRRKGNYGIPEVGVDSDR